MEHHKFERVLKMDRRSVYDQICKKGSCVKNDSKTQLEKFKSTLNRGKIKNMLEESVDK